jgi:hypothetical protein
MGCRLTIDAGSQRAQKAGILAMLRAAAPAVVKAAGFELAQVAVDRISGLGTIRRVDTTRYRGSIGAAAKEATGRQVEIHEYSAAVSELIRRTDKMRGESDSGPAEPDLLTPGDYEGNIEKWNFGASLRMVTFVPYAPFLEWGWTREDGSGMKAGYHLTGAAQQGKPVIIPAAQKALTASVRGH